MKLDEKIGQLFVVPAFGRFMNESSSSWRELARHVTENHVGGVIWFLSNIYETAWLNAKLQQAAPVPLLMSADLEAGMGMRFVDATFWPPAMAVAATGDPSLAGEQGRITAREAKCVGIDHILAPVADVNVNPANPVINARSFGEDPARVAQFVSAFIRGVQGEGALATAKHFPGHGDTHVDSHRALPRLDVSRDRLDAVELVPFRAAIDAGVASVMIGHLSVAAIDPAPAPVRTTFENSYGTTADEVPDEATLPATVSKPLVDGLLRDTLGFDGLVVSDAFDMGGIAAHFDPGEAAVRAIEAGLDQVLYPADVDAAIEGVRSAVRSGRLPVGRIDESVERILAAKRRAGLPRPVQFEEIFRTVDAAAHVAVAEEIAARSVTLVRDRAGLLPLTRLHPPVVVVSDLPEENPLREAVRLLAPSRLVEVDAQTDEALAGAIAGDLVVMLLALRPKSGAGRIAMPLAARAIAAKVPNVIAISFGSPYVLRDLPDVGTFISAWGIQPVMQRAAIAALSGRAAFRGSMPVTLDG